MRVRIEIDDHASEDEVIIRCSHLNNEIETIQKAIAEMVGKKQEITLYQNDTRFYIPVEQILFFETDASKICAHTASDIYTASYKLYELEEILPRYFMRVSKSTILNTRQIYSITRNLSSSSVVEFQDTIKQVYVSRYYYKQLKSRMEEQRG